MSRIRFLIPMLCSVHACVAFAQANPTFGASISGMVTDERGALIRGAQVTASRVAGSRLTVLLSPQFAITGATGDFTVTGLPPGLYRLCANVFGSDLLNPCEWSDNPPAMSVGVSEQRGGVRIVLRRGKKLNVRVDDARKLLKRNAKGGAEDLLLVRVWSARGAHVVPLASEDPYGQNFQLPVPVGVPLKLDASSSRLAVKAKGEAKEFHLNEGRVDAAGRPFADSFVVDQSATQKQFWFGVQEKGK